MNCALTTHALVITFQQVATRLSPASMTRRKDTDRIAAKVLLAQLARRARLLPHAHARRRGARRDQFQPTAQLA